MIGTNRLPRIDLFEREMSIESIVDDLQKYPSYGCMSPSYITHHAFEDINIEPLLSYTPNSSDDSANNSEDSNTSVVDNEVQELIRKSYEENWDFSRILLPQSHVPSLKPKVTSDYNSLMDELEILSTSPLSKFINDKSMFELCVDPEEIYQTNFSKVDNSLSKFESSDLFGDRSTSSLNLGLGNIYNSELGKCERFNPDWPQGASSSPETSIAESSDSETSSHLFDSDIELDGVDLELERFEPESFMLSTNFDTEAEEQSQKDASEMLNVIVKSEKDWMYEQQILSTRLDHDYCSTSETSSEEQKPPQNKLNNCTSPLKQSLDDMEDVTDEKDDLKDATWYPSAPVSKKRRGRPPNNPQNKRLSTGRTKHSDKVTKAKSLTLEKKCTKSPKSPENRRGHNAKERDRRAEITSNLAEIERRTPSDICRVTFQAIQNVKSVEDSENELSGKVIRETIRMMKRNSVHQQQKKRASPKKFSKMTVLLSSVYYLKYDLEISIKNKKEYLEELLKRKRKLRKLKH